jgi:5-methylcytosine-specific restriction endonuclease McrBC regulatory subunit McrC
VKREAMYSRTAAGSQTEVSRRVTNSKQTETGRRGIGINLRVIEIVRRKVTETSRKEIEAILREIRTDHHKEIEIDLKAIETDLRRVINLLTKARKETIQVTSNAAIITEKMKQKAILVYTHSCHYDGAHLLRSQQAL